MKPALTTRLGGAGILVSPKMCLTVTEPSLATSPASATLQAATSGRARSHREETSPGPHSTHPASVTANRSGSSRTAPAARPSATTMLTTVAEANTAIGRQPGLAQALQRELQADRDEREDQEPGAQVVDGGDVGRACRPPAHCRYSVPMTDAATKPSTNFGKRSQNWPSVGRASSAACVRPCSAKYAVSAIATTPINAFWVVLTMVAICSASSPAIAPAAVTAAVVSMLPPIHAPATASDSPKHVGQPRQQEDRRQREGDHQRCRVGELFALGLHRACGRDGRADPADRHRRREQRAQLVVEAEPAAEPPGEPEHDGDQQQRLDDRRTGRGDEHA